MGDTVRRPAGPQSAFVRGLLRGLADEGFKGAPLSLGQDGEGRDVFSWLEGTVPADLQHHPDAVLRAAARLIRTYHDATVALLTREAREAGSEVVCHGDLSPCNTVLRQGLPVALIDFDTAAPGRRLDDLGYAAWLWLDIGNDEATPAEQARRLALFCAGYGEGTADAVIDAMLAQQTNLASRARTPAEVRRWARACQRWVERHRPALGAPG